ncbi:MAG: AsmA-like C-terminal region-containing protein [Flavobacteriales bacterium]
MRILKRILLALIVLTILMVGSSAAYIYYQQDELEQVVIKEINKRLKSPIKIGDIEFSVIKNFPFASIELNNILAIDAFQEDTLCEIELLQLKFNALDLYNNIFIIQELTLKNGFASIYYKDSMPNYEIWHSTQDSSQEENTDFGLENISLENFKIAYAVDDIQSVIVNNESQLQLSINNGRTEINLEGDITNEKLILDGINHLPSKKINLNGDIVIDTLGVKIKSAIALSDIQMDLDFESTDKAMTVKVNTSEFELEPTLKLIPKNYLSALEGYELQGKSKIRLNYISDQQKEAYINVDFDLKEGYIKGKDLPFDMNETSLKGSYSNGKQRTDASTEIKLDNIQFTANGELVQANATIQGLENPTLITDFNTQMQLSEIEKWGYEHDFKSLIGDAKIKGTYKGKIGLKNKVTYDLAMAEKTADLTIDNLSLHSDEQSPQLSNAKLSLKLIDDNVNISAFNGTLAKESKIKFVGGIENVFSYLFLKNAELKIAGDLSSDWMIIDEFLDETDNISETTQESKPQAINLPNDIVANINLNLIDLTFDRFHMRNFSSKISYKNKLLKAKDIVLETMSGKITSNVTFEQVKDGKLRLISTTGLDNINVRQLFYEFHNFGQTTMRHKHLKGKIDSEIYLRNEWDKYFNPIDEHLYSFIDVKINNGELLDFEPLMMMSDYISVEELKRIKFSTLENQIEIKNNLIDIPFMEIHSTAIDIAGAGTHSFDNEMDYEFKILLNEILGDKFRRKNKKKVSEFGVVQDDGVKGMTMFLKMQGTVDDPQISYNTLRLRESLSDGFKKEKKELKDVIKNQFKDKNNDNHIQGNPDYDNIIEWEE